MSERLIQRHDQFFKRLLDQPGAAAALLRERLPPAVAARLSDADPELLAASFVSDALQEHRSDRLYRAQLRHGPALLVHVLVEHKSTPDPHVALQLLAYQAQILAQWRPGQDPEPPAVVSLVVYHGEASWRIPLSLAERLTDDAELRPHLLDFRYNLVDLGHIEDAALSACAGLRVGFLALKHAGREGPTRELLLRLGRAAWALGMGDFIAVLRYILKEENAVTTALLREVIDAVAPTPKEPLMSIALEEFKREWLAEGWEKGRLDGLSQGLEKGLSQGLEKGLSQGLEKGLSQGLEKGLSQGLVAGQLGVLNKLAVKRFGPLPDVIRLKLAEATSEQLERWAETILDAASLDDWLV